jgi:hypothetical protein
MLDELSARGYELLSVEAMPATEDRKAVYLRHDVDLHIPGIERIAAVESDLGVSATYFVPLSLHFNPAYPENRAILRGLVAAGHSIGLHYDLSTYPADESRALQHLDWEVEVLSKIVDAQVKSICMHFPWGGRDDIPRYTDRYIHPQAPRFDAVGYISDSCRAWRDESLLACLVDAGPERVLLNTHPELWLGEAGEDRWAFLNGTLLDNTTRQHRAYITEYMGPAWEVHPAPKAHDERESRL